jgi:hypothetical protein
MFKFILAVFLGISLNFYSSAQGESDTLVTEKAINIDSIHQLDKLPLENKVPYVTPKKAALFSAILPGLGQITNRHYWKLPIIYAGVGIAGYFIAFNSEKHNYYRKLYAGRLNNDPKYLEMDSRLTNENVKYLQDAYRRDLDLTVLLTAVGYGLQVMDAVVFAHLKNFDISEDISLRLKPTALPAGGIGLGLVMNF